MGELNEIRERGERELEQARVNVRQLETDNGELKAKGEMLQNRYVS